MTRPTTELFQITDRVTVMKDGRVVTTAPTADLDTDRLIRLMVGRDVETNRPEPRVG